MNREDYMRRAIEQALKVPEFPFGAVIVSRKTGEIVAEGFNQSALSPTFHGEIVAINHCAEIHPSVDWRELDLYTTAEPCPMCQSAIEWAGIAAVYFGTSMPYLQEHGWRQIEIRASEVSAKTTFRNTHIFGGVLESECNALFDQAPKGVFHKK
jgi:tRNA(Arg) A34 adenosine deaminase TadA